MLRPGRPQASRLQRKPRPSLPLRPQSDGRRKKPRLPSRLRRAKLNIAKKLRSTPKQQPVNRQGSAELLVLYERVAKGGSTISRESAGAALPATPGWETYRWLRRGNGGSRQRPAPSREENRMR